VAVRSSDQRVDCVGACVGVRGNRIKNIIDELAGERIDIVRYNDNPQELISNALAPAEVDQVILCPKIGRAIVLVREDQLSLAIGRRGQNVRLASKLCGWDIEIMTQEELEDQAVRAMEHFSQIEGVTEELADKLVGEGYLSYDDLSVIEPEELMALGGLSEEEVMSITDQAEEKALEAEQAAADERRRQRDQEKNAPAAAAAPPAEEAAAGDGDAVTTEEELSEEALSEETAETGEYAEGGEEAYDHGDEEMPADDLDAMAEGDQGEPGSEGDEPSELDDSAEVPR
jgi:N utilization substance protein A